AGTGPPGIGDPTGHVNKSRHVNAETAEAAEKFLTLLKATTKARRKPTYFSCFRAFVVAFSESELCAQMSSLSLGTSHCRTFAGRRSRRRCGRLWGSRHHGFWRWRGRFVGRRLWHPLL